MWLRLATGCGGGHPLSLCYYLQSLLFNQQRKFLANLSNYFPPILHYIVANEAHVKVPRDLVVPVVKVRHGSPRFCLCCNCCIQYPLKCLVQFLKMHTNGRFDSLIDITCVDYPDRKLRFEEVIQVLGVLV